MYDVNPKETINFAPRQSEIQLSLWESQETIADEQQQYCSPGKVFERHGSLAELSTIAVTEKEALDRQENSQSSDSSESCNSTIEIENEGNGHGYDGLKFDVAAQFEVQSTPTKLSAIESSACNSDPLTPTANLKMLMSVVSPAIRDRDEKKRDLFVKDAGNADFENASGEVVIEKPNAYNRKDKSLGLLCQRFLAKFPENPGENGIEISLDEVSKDLKVERRRVYDIVNVLESVEVLSRLAKNRYSWHGKSRIIQTLGKLKALSESSFYKASQQLEKENSPHTQTFANQKMKRYFSCGDLPKPNRQWNEINFSKDEERLMIKAAIDSTDNGRKDKSLGVLSQKFIIMFLLSRGGVVTLEDAANVLLEEHDERNVKYKTKVRRLYDIANILSSLKLIEKVHIRGSVGKKPGFKWIGVDIDSLPENTVPSGSVMTFKTKHSLLPDLTSYPKKPRPPCAQTRHPYILPSPGPAHASTLVPTKRWTKSASCSASFVRRSSSKDEHGVKRERSNGSTAHGPDGFLVHEFAPSPVNLLGRDVSLCSPTEVTFREEIQKLREKFPDRMSQLLALLPPCLPSSCPGSVNKSSRRNLFNKNKMNASTSESSPKRVRKNSEGDFHSVNIEGSTNTDSQATEKDAVLADKENEEQQKLENESKFMHSTNSPFKVMSACVYGQSDNQILNPRPANVNMVNSNGMSILGERSQQGMFLNKPRQRSSCQWQHMVGHFKTSDGRTSPMVQLVDQAVSPIPPSKFASRNSIAIQASLIKDISPLKPLVFLQHRIPSPWKPRAGSPSCIPPAPPTTPELSNEAGMGPFQSQGSRMFLQSVSPYPLSGSQSCGTSPVGPYTGAKLFFPPSPNTPSNITNSMLLPQGNLLYGINQVIPSTMNHSMTPPLQSNSCPPSVNPSPIPVDSGLTYTPGIVLPLSQIPNQCNNVPVGIQVQTPELFTRPATLTPVSEISNFTPYQLEQPPTGKRPCMLMIAEGLRETPSSIVDAAANENVSRKLCLTNENS